MTRTVALTIIAACLEVSAVTSSPAGQIFDVQNVDASDVLNMRAVGPGTDSIGDAEIVGTIPHDGTNIVGSGLSVEVNGVRWRQVRYGETIGWVNGGFLEPQNGSFELDEEDSLVCSGTEPFWVLMIAGETASFTDPEIGGEPVQMSVKASRRGLNRKGLWFHYLEAAMVGQTCRWWQTLPSNAVTACRSTSTRSKYS